MRSSEVVAWSCKTRTLKGSVLASLTREAVRAEGYSAAKTLERREDMLSVACAGRLTDIHKTTILSLLKTVGDNHARLFDARVQNMRPRFVQADEAWTFVQQKQ
jgi:hypothetical protein